MSTDYNAGIAKAIRDFLDKDDWHYNFDEEKGRFDLGITLKSRLKSTKVVIRVNESSYTVYDYLSISAGSDNETELREVALFLSYANYGLRNGNFEMDPSDGEMRYKSFVDCGGGAIPTYDIIEASLYVPPTMIDRYADGILGIIFGGASAKDAIEKCEADK